MEAPSDDSSFRKVYDCYRQLIRRRLKEHSDSAKETRQWRWPYLVHVIDRNGLYQAIMHAHGSGGAYLIWKDKLWSESKIKSDLAFDLVVVTDTFMARGTIFLDKGDEKEHVTAVKFRESKKY